MSGSARTIPILGGPEKEKAMERLLATGATKGRRSYPEGPAKTQETSFATKGKATVRVNQEARMKSPGTVAFLPLC